MDIEDGLAQQGWLLRLQGAAEEGGRHSASARVSSRRGLWACGVWDTSCSSLADPSALLSMSFVPAAPWPRRCGDSRRAVWGSWRTAPWRGRSQRGWVQRRGARPLGAGHDLQ